MKKFLTYSIMAFTAVMVLTSCSKRDYYDNGNDNYEQGIVAATDYSPWFLVSFDNGDYAIMKAVETNNKYWPMYSDVLNGYFKNTGSRSFKNISKNYTFNGLIVSFRNNLDDAKADWNYYATKDGYPEKTALSRKNTISVTEAAKTNKLN